LKVPGSPGGVASMEERGVSGVPMDADPKLLDERDLVLIGTTCFIVLTFRDNISAFDCRSSSEPSRIEAHLRSHLRFG
jgi:hypothetical protein